MHADNVVNTTKLKTKRVLIIFCIHFRISNAYPSWLRWSACNYRAFPTSLHQACRFEMWRRRASRLAI